MIVFKTRLSLEPCVFVGGILKPVADSIHIQHIISTNKNDKVPTIEKIDIGIDRMRTEIFADILKGNIHLGMMNLLPEKAAADHYENLCRMKKMDEETKKK